MSFKLKDGSYESGYSQNWERFMLLWSLTPEIFVGSCILSILAVIVVYFITRVDSNVSMDGRREFSDAISHSDESRDSSKMCKSRQFLNQRTATSRHSCSLKDTAEIKGEGNMLKCGGIEFPFNELTSYKKSLYRVAAEKLEKSLTDKQLSEEREVQRQQLKEIYDLMKSKEEVFGISNLNQMEEQMKFYG